MHDGRAGLLLMCFCFSVRDLITGNRFRARDLSNHPWYYNLGIKPIYISTVVEHATVFNVFDQLVISATDAPTTIIIDTEVTRKLLPIETQ